MSFFILYYEIKIFCNQKISFKLISDKHYKISLQIMSSDALFPFLKEAMAAEISPVVIVLFSAACASLGIEFH